MVPPQFPSMVKKNNDSKGGDKKSADKKKDDKKNKGRGDDGEDDKQSKVKASFRPGIVDPNGVTKGKGLKPATAINVRHILCEKHSKASEALQKIQVTDHNHLFLLEVSYHVATTGRPIIQQSRTRIFRR